MTADTTAAALPAAPAETNEPAAAAPVELPKSGYENTHALMVKLHDHFLNKPGKITVRVTEDNGIEVTVPGLYVGSDLRAQTQTSLAMKGIHVNGQLKNGIIPPEYTMLSPRQQLSPQSSGRFNSIANALHEVLRDKSNWASRDENGKEQDKTNATLTTQPDGSVTATFTIAPEHLALDASAVDISAATRSIHAR